MLKTFFLEYEILSYVENFQSIMWTADENSSSSAHNGENGTLVIVKTNIDSVAIQSV